MKNLLLSVIVIFFYTTVAAQAGRIGINTNSPLAMLHVQDSSVLFTGPPFVINPGNPPVSGGGIRMMWYAARAAFRAGYVLSSNWDKENIGITSFASGFNTKASGDYSTALGSYTIASGGNSTAIGYLTTASANYSMALGYGGTASGVQSTVMGGGTLATGINSTATGESTQANGYASFSGGYLSVAGGSYSNAFGHSTISKGFAATTIGLFNDPILATDETAVTPTTPLFIIGNGVDNNNRKNALVVLKNGKTGINTSSPLAMLHVKDSSVLFSGATSLPVTPGDPPISGAGIRMMWYPDKAAFRVGRASATSWEKDSIGDYSFGAGTSAKASNISSIALGNGPVASGFASVALGDVTLASGTNSTAIGFSTVASGSQSTALGINTLASGFWSTAMGFSTIATGAGSTAMGAQTTSFGNYSTAIGRNTNAKGYASTVIGMYNDSILAVNEVIVSTTTPLLIVGNGDAVNNRSNAMVVQKNGNVSIGNFLPQYKLDVGERMRLRSGGSAGTSPGIWLNDIGNTTTPAFIGMADDSHIGFYGTGAGWDFVMNLATGNVGVGTQAPTQRLHVVGNICYTGTIGACSDIRYKKNISSINNALNSVLKLQGIYYDWEKEKFKDKGFTDDRQLGFSAQEVEKLFPQIVLTDQHGYKSVDYGRLTPVLVEAIKELKQEIDELKKIISQKK
jgi:Chaperone of endosialidase/Head domain of trimeric autotransporter adhesin